MYRKCKTGSNKIEEFFQQFATGTYVYALQSSNRDGTSNIFGVLDAVFFIAPKKKYLSGKGCTDLTEMQLCLLLHLSSSEWADVYILKKKVGCGI